MSSYQYMSVLAFIINWILTVKTLLTYMMEVFLSSIFLLLTQQEEARGRSKKNLEDNQSEEKPEK